MPALAQSAPVPAVAPGASVLTVSAEGRSLRAPDYAVFTAGVSSRAATAEQALKDNSAAMTRTIAALKRAGAAERDIQTSNLSIDPVYSDPANDAARAARISGQPVAMPADPTPRIVAYSVTNTVTVRQRKLGEYGALIDALVKAGANQVNGPSFQIDDNETALNEARAAAIKTAQARANLYAAAANLKVARILSISESGGYFAPQPVSNMRFAEADLAAPPPPPPLQPGEMQMTTQVTVNFELTP